MSLSLRFALCLVGISLLGGCTIAEPAYRADLGGYAMIEEVTQPTVISAQAEKKDQPVKS